jgi:hypothetical protein
MKIQHGDFSTRTFNILRNYKITTYEELSKLTENEMLSYRNFGKGCANEILEKRNIKTKKYTIKVRTISGDSFSMETEKPFKELAMYISNDIVFDLDENFMLKGSQIESIQKVM